MFINIIFIIIILYLLLSFRILGERIVELDAKILHMNCTEKSPSRLSPRSPFTHADVGIQYDFQDLQNV